MQKFSNSESGAFYPRMFVALALWFVAVSFGLYAFAQTPGNSSLTAVAAPGFHAPVTMPGSTGGSEPSLAITNSNNGFFPNGMRYVSWQVPGEFAKSADGVN